MKYLYLAGIVLALYFINGIRLALKITPISANSRPLGKNALFVIRFWPVLYVAQGIKRITGKYPSWTPNL